MYYLLFLLAEQSRYVYRLRRCLDTKTLCHLNAPNFGPPIPFHNIKPFEILAEYFPKLPAKKKIKPTQSEAK